MIAHENLVVVTLDQTLLDIVLQQAKLSSIGGSSQARKSDRQNTLGEDQISGHACHMAASIYLFGNIDKFKNNEIKPMPTHSVVMVVSTFLIPALMSKVGISAKAYLFLTITS